MPPCLDNLVTIRNVKCPDASVQSLSGFDLMDAPEISVTKLNSIADEVYGTGMELAKQKLKLATVMLQNDLIRFLSANRIAPQLAHQTVASGVFDTTRQWAGSTADERGFTVVLTQNNRTGRLRVMRIGKVKVYAFQNQTGARLNVTAGGVTTFWLVDLIGGQVNEFVIDHLITGSSFRITLSGVAVPLAYVTLNCSCNGTLPSGFGSIEGYRNGTAVRKEGFGIVAELQPDCDYGQLLCDMARGFTGELLWLKARILILEERLMSSRFNNWIVFGKEESETLLRNLRGEYAMKWQDFGGALPNLLRAYEGECIICNGAKWVVNL
ncbi:MAG: hypothetical protein EOP52_13445 [Sphingobacteriales bacterium]|nr:MAG: hypothetical protein EOP52_13445 [Sphingobacteriales bacterium]